MFLYAATLDIFGFSLYKRDEPSLPPRVLEHFRARRPGVYRGQRKGYKAWRRFARVCAAERRRLDEAASPVRENAAPG